jgi:hypothetical protein
MTVDRKGNYYGPNDCLYFSDTRVAEDPDPTRQAVEKQNGQQMPNFRSIHHGLVHMAFADGTVRPITDSIAPEIHMSLSTIDGGEVLSDY